MDFAAVVVGGGVVGAAVAAELSRSRTPSLLIEQCDRPGTGCSSRNSGVVHAGIYHPREWLKSRLCIIGRRQIEELAVRHELPYQRCGKLIVAQDAEEEEHLTKLLERGHDAGVEGLEMLGREAVARLEPEIRSGAALYSKHSAIIDPHALIDLFLHQARDLGCEVLTSARVVGAEAIEGGFRLEIREPDGEVATCSAEVVVNAAGLEADEVAALFGIDVDSVGYRQHYARGDYWRIAPRHRSRVKHLVYPVPPRGLAGLGVHLTLELDGGLRLGPDVRWLAGREQRFEVDLEGGDRFHAAGARYLPFLEREDLTPDMAGIRAKASAEGESGRDFVIREETSRKLPGLVNLIGIESPGLTASPAIAAYVVDLLS